MTPESWADGTHRWDGYLTAAEFPRIVNPDERPHLDRERAGRRRRDAGGDRRGRLCRRHPRAADSRSPDATSTRPRRRTCSASSSRIARCSSSDGASCCSTTLGPVVGSGRASARNSGDLVDTNWTGRASPGSVGYRLVKEFRLLFVRRVMTSLTAPALAVDPAFDYTRLLRGEGPVWQIVAERPMHLLDPKYKTWDDAILDTVDAVIAQLTEGGKSLADRTWGEANSAEIRHPLAGAIPFFGSYLNMPGDPLPGDVYTPRASTPRTGPSERMAVSPGRESEGILHMPTGQSGHPLSPHYGDQYRAWLIGEPTPFLPGATVNTLVLTPRQ